MSQAKANAPVSEPKLPRRDWILLPLIALLTILLIMAPTEWIARRAFTGSSDELERCHTFRDPVSGIGRVSNCVYWVKAFEAQPTQYRMNSSGYRSDVEFGAKSPGTFRIVLVGSSVGLGASTQRENTFAAMLPEELSKRTGRPVELYNESIPGIPGLPQSVALRFKDVLATKPDLVLWEVGRWDIKETLTRLPAKDEPTEQRASSGAAWLRVKEDIAKHDTHRTVSDLMSLGRSFLVSMKGTFDDSRTAFMLQHFLYQSPNIYVRYFLSGPDEFAGYLKAVPSAAWQARLQAFDADVASVQAQAAAAGVPLAVVTIPSFPQADMIAMGVWPAGYDPDKLDDELHSIVVNHGATYIDIFPGFRTISNPGQYFLPMDGHPNAGGHAIISGLLASELSNGAVPGLKTTLSQQNVLMGTR
jgi:hypothetical protein